MNTIGEENENDRKLEDGIGERVSRRQFFGLVGGAAAVMALGGGAAGLLAGCSSSSNGTGGTNKNSSTIAGIKTGGTLKIGVLPVASLGWPVSIMGQGQGVNQGVYETLLRSDSDGNVSPWLAENWAIAKDEKSITLNLRKGVKFHDGSDLTAAVVKWNLEQYMAAHSVKNWKSVDVVDDNTVRVNFTKWDNTLLLSFADSSFEVYMISKAAFDSKGQQWLVKNPVGTGPFKFVSFQQDVGFKSVRNPTYWKKDAQGVQLPYLDALEYSFIKSAVSMRNALQAKELDVATLGLSDSDMKSDTLDFRTKIAGMETIVPDLINTGSPWANQKFREAVEYGIDKESIATTFGYGQLQAPYQMMPSDSKAFNKDFTLARKYDPEKAKQLLKESGLTLPIQTTLIVSQPDLRDTALAMVDTLGNIGIKLKLDFPDVGRWITYIMGPWPKNSALYTPYPAEDPTYALGLQFLLNTIGPSWKPTPELKAAFDAAYVTPKIDETKIRAATDIITRDALLIPVKQSPTCQGAWTYAHVDYEKRGGPGMWNTETAWINK